MKQNIFDPPINSPLALSSPQGGSPQNSFYISGFQFPGQQSANTTPKRREIKKYTASLQRITQDLSLNPDKQSSRNNEASIGIPILEKIKKRPDFKSTDSKFYNRSSSKYSMSFGNDYYSSCNNSIISDNPLRSSIKESKSQIGNDISIKLPPNKLLSKYHHSASMRNSSAGPFKLKNEDYAEKLSSLQDQISKLIDQDAWNEQINKQLQNYSTQTRLSIDKVYSKLSASSDEVDLRLIETLFEKENCFIKIIKLIKTMHLGVVSSSNFLNHQFKNMAEENKSLKLKFQEDKLKQAEVQDTNPVEIKNLLQNTLRKTERNERVWVVEKSQLEAQIHKLSKEIEVLQDMTNLNNLKKQHESFQTSVFTKIKEFEKEVEEKDMKILKLENIVGRSTNALRELQKEHKDLTKRYSDLSDEYDSHKKDFQKDNDKQIMYREMALMQREEFLQIRSKCDSLAESLSKTQKRYLDVQHKFDKLKREQSEMAVVNEEEFEKDSSLLNVLKQGFTSTSKRQAIQTRLNNTAMGSSPTDANQDNIQLEKYAFNKPTFYVFIQQEIEAEMAEAKQKPEEKSLTIDRQSLSNIRAILDSKFNELCYNDDYRLHSPFPDFVYSWLSNFYVCPQEKKIKITSNDNITQVQARRTNLYKFLLNPKMNKIWDVAIFREFLEEKCSSDEIYFYLTCRYLIFQGSQLSYFSSCLNPVHWVPFDRVENLVELVFKKMGQEDFNTLKYKIKDRAKKKANKYFIDAGFVLRVLLEFYRNEKKLKIVMLQEALNKVSVYGKNNKPHVTYDIFKQFLEINYPFASELEKARLYREAWHIGNGIVDYESFFIAANESNFFTGGLKYSIFPKLPTLDNYSVSKEDHELVQEMNKLVEDKYKELLEVFEKGKSFARMLGVESMVSNVTQAENNLTKNFNSIYDESKGHGIFIIFNELVQMFLKIRNQYFIVSMNSASNENQLAKTDIAGLESILKSIDYYALLDQANLMEKNNKVRKFQLYFRRKKKGWLKVMKNLLVRAKSKHNVV